MSNLIFLPAPWYVAVPDFDEEPLRLEEPLASPPPISFNFWILALALVLVAAPDALFAQSRSGNARKIFAKLQNFELGAEIEVKLRSRERIQGRLAWFDETVLRLDGLPDPIPLADISNVKEYAVRSQGPRWNPVTGFVQGWKSAAIVGGLLVGLIVLVATNTA